MRRHSHAPARTRVAHLTLIALAALLLLSTAGCKASSNSPIIEFRGTNVATGTVQAPMANAATSAPAPDSSAGSVVPSSAPSVPTQQNPSAAPAQAPMQNSGQAPQSSVWPAKVGQFAANFKGPVWFPKTIPTGYKVDSIDVVEFDPGSGLVCDAVWLNNGKVLELMQGAPKNRSYPITSAGKVKWGTDTADVVKQDPTSASSPVSIVYSKGGTFAELSGDLTLDQLKLVAASMVAVK